MPLDTVRDSKLADSSADAEQMDRYSNESGQKICRPYGHTKVFHRLQPELSLVLATKQFHIVAMHAIQYCERT